MAKSLLALLFIALSYTSYANAGYNVVTPTTGTILYAGYPANITWTMDNTTPNDPLVDVVLNNGPPESLNVVSTICSGVDPKVGVCNFNVPANIASGIDYAITVGKKVENLAYGSYFTIKGTGDLPPNNGCPNMGGHVCASADLACCGPDGYCGKGTDFCGAGCQQQFSLAGACKGGKTNPKRRRALNYY